MQGFRPPTLETLPPVVKNLIIINVLLYLGAQLANYDRAVELLGLFYPASHYFRPHQLVTHMFMHGGLSHLFFNMFALYMFGRMLATVWGGKRFLIYYMATGLGAAALHLAVSAMTLGGLGQAAAAFVNTPSPELFAAFVRDYVGSPSMQLRDFVNAYLDNPDSHLYAREATLLVERIAQMRTDVPVIGASGAVFGVLLAFGMMFPNAELMLLFPPIPIKAKWFVLGYGLVEFFAGVSNRSGDNVAHFAHLGGMIFGFFLIRYWNRRRYC